MSQTKNAAVAGIASGANSVSAVSGNIVLQAPSYSIQTPSAIKYWLGGILLSCLFAGMLLFNAIGHIQDAVKTIGYDTKPSVVAAMQARVHMAEMDAETANEALVGTGGSTVGTSQDFIRASNDLNSILIGSAQNVTYGDAEVQPLKDIQRWLAQYNQEIGSIRGIGDGNPWLTHRRIAWASRVIRNGAMEASERLEKANLDPLNAAWDKFDSKARSAEIELFLGFAILGFVMVGSQQLMMRRTRRLLNLPMVVASILVVSLTAVSIYEISVGKSSIRTAKVDAFDSVESLNRAKTLLFKMNADESLWLMDPDAARADAEASFWSSSDALLPARSSVQQRLVSQLPDRLNEALQMEKSGESSAALKHLPTLDGLIGKAIDNVTFGVDERQPLTSAVIAYLDYIKIDGQIRDLERRGEHKAAIDLCLGSAPGQSDWAFTRVIDGVEKAIEVNDAVFEAKVAQTTRVMRWLPWAGGLGLVAVFALSAIGSWLRLKEYS